MRTKQEVNNYLNGFALKRSDVDFILGFLCGKGINVYTVYTSKNGISFKEFKEWFDNNEKSKLDDNKEDVNKNEDENSIDEEINKLKESVLEMKRLILSSPIGGLFMDIFNEVIEEAEEIIAEHEKNKLEEASNELRKYKVDASKIDDSEYIEGFEVMCHEAIENIIDNIQSGDLTKEEKQSVIDALEVLVDLGNMYE